MPNARNPKQYRQGKYWILTIPQHQFTPYKPANVGYIVGQLERGSNTGFLHWQLMVCFLDRQRLRGVTDTFGSDIHAELSRSSAAEAYCTKNDDTYVAGTRFELGAKPIKRNAKTDWDRIRGLAMGGQLLEIPSDIFVRHYSALRAIRSDFSQPQPVFRTVNVYWGTTGLGKSRRAWHEAGYDAYPKSPSTKFWDGYRDHDNVVIDEFTGQIAIEHLLRWFDRYPVNVEIKGSSVTLKADTFWITSNVNPELWYPDKPESQRDALLRRLNIIHFTEEWKPDDE